MSRMIRRVAALCLLTIGLPVVGHTPVWAQGLVPIEVQKGSQGSYNVYKGSTDSDSKYNAADDSPADNAPRDSNTPPGSSHQTASDIDTFVQGNLLFTLYHESGHALISLFDLPILAREEDAVDNLATLLMLPDQDGTDQEEALLLSAMDGWFMSDEAATEQDEPFAFWDEHGLDAQRGYQIACLLIGSDPEYFADLASSLEIPQDRVESCVEDEAKVAISWDAVLSKHMLNDDEQPQAKVTVIYDTARGTFARWPPILRQWGLAERVADDLTHSFRLPHDLTIVYAQCDESNAWWDPEENSLTICYEILQEFYDLANL